MENVIEETGSGEKWGRELGKGSEESLKEASYGSDKINSGYGQLSSGDDITKKD